MDKTGFELYLQKLGKKPATIYGLVDLVERFENHVNRSYRVGLENVSPQILHEYADHPAQRKEPSLKETLRSLALYFRFCGATDLAELASNLREELINRTKKSILLKEFPGIDPKDLQALQAVGVRSSEQILEAGKDALARQKLSSRTGVSRQVIIELVKLSDLARIFGVKGIRARLYHDAGIDTVEKMASLEPDILLKKAIEFVEGSRFKGIAPQPKEALFTIQAARALHNLVDFTEE